MPCSDLFPFPSYPESWYHLTSEIHYPPFLIMKSIQICLKNFWLKRLFIFITQVRIQTMPGYAKTLREALPKMYADEGFGGFYKGLVPLWLRQIPYTMMKFACFERTVELLYKHVVPKPRIECTKGEQLIVTFAAGYIAGVFCAVVSHPADSVSNFSSFNHYIAFSVLTDCITNRLKFALTGRVQVEPGEGSYCRRCRKATWFCRIVEGSCTQDRDDRYSDCCPVVHLRRG